VIINLPHNGWKVRPYQQPFWDAWQKHDVRRLIEIAHRRWGKDDVCLHGACIKAHERPANYWHAFPEYAQARKGIWTAINPHTGKRRIDEAFPMELRESTNESEMLIKFKVGYGMPALTHAYIMLSPCMTTLFCASTLVPTC
jgi:hypothetical protein